MRFEDFVNPKALRGYLPEFLSLVGSDRWKKRALALATEAQRSPFQEKIVSDYHWLELGLSSEMIIHEYGASDSARVELSGLAALHFAQAIVEIHRSVSPLGKKTIEGRLRDGLKAETGFAALYLEAELTGILNAQGYDLQFPDLEGTGQYDIQFRKGGATGEVECKSLSADAGRKIHRKDFYRLIDRLQSHICDRLTKGGNELLLVTLEDRLPSDANLQKPIMEALQEMLLSASPRSEGNGFLITREIWESDITSARYNSERELYRAFQEVFGESCHVSGVASEDGSQCLIAMRSQLPDDHSKPQLDAMKKAADQFSGNCPGFIAVQFNDIKSADLMLPHLRERAAILSSGLFCEGTRQHVAATYFSAFAGAQITADGQHVGHPAFACWNPTFAMPLEDLPFRSGPPDIEWLRMFGGNDDAR